MASVRDVDKPAKESNADMREKEVLGEHSSVDDKVKRTNDMLTPNYEERAGCVSRWFLLWFSKILSMSYYKSTPLTSDDLGPVAKIDESAHQHAVLDSLWQQEIKSVGVQKASLWNVWLRFIGWGELAFLLFIQIITALASTGPPLIGFILIRFIEGKVALDVYQQVGLLVLLILCPLTSGVTNSIMMFRGKRASLHSYAALTTAMYRKALRLSSVGVSQISTGRLVNMFSTDAEKSMERVVIMMIPAVIAPVQFFAYLALIWLQIGWTVFASVGLIVLILPLNITIFRNVLGAYAGSQQATDKRVKLINELITGIRIVKFYAWEKPFEAVIDAAREAELGWIKRHAYWMAIGMQSVFLQLPGLIQISAIATFVLTGNTADPAVIFTTLMFFQLLQGPVTQLPNALSQIIQVHVGLKRIGIFLKTDERSGITGEDLRTKEFPSIDSGINCVAFHNVSASWGRRIDSETAEANEKQHKGRKTKKKRSSTGSKMEEAVVKKPDSSSTSGSDTFPPVLSDMTFSVKPGELVMIVGEVGSGKTSLLLTIANETMKMAGSIQVRGGISLATQNAFVFSDTLQRNITFGNQLKASRYRKVVQACALESDLEQIIGGDQVALGERGINLSGGQKARVGLARACYAESDIVLLDDVLAAVDSHVGDHIFDRCILELLKGRTRIFATNQLHRLQHADLILYVAGNEIVAQSRNGVEAMMCESESFREMMRKSGISASEYDNSKEEKVPVGDRKLVNTVASIEETRTYRSISNGSCSSDQQQQETMKKNAAMATALHTEEEKQVGRVSREVWGYYLQMAGPCFFALASAGVSLQLYIKAGGNMLMGVWTSDVSLRNYSITNFELQKSKWYDHDSQMIGFLGLINVASFLSMVGGAYMFAQVRVRVARNTHSHMLKRILCAPVSFFDVTPLGRILNRFTSDQKSIDFMLSMMFMWAVVVTNMLVSAFLAMAISTWGLLVIVFLPLGIAYFYVVNWVRHVSIELQRLEANARSPIYTSFSELLAGLITVRAFHEERRFMKDQITALDKHIQPYFMVRTALLPWLTLRINIMSAVLLGGIGGIALFLPKGFIQPGLLGVALTYTLIVDNFLRIVIFITTELEVQMNSVERIKYYGDQIPKEAASDIEETAPPQEWPKNGEISVRNLVMGYRDGPDVLKNISFDIKPGQKVALVGRTGSGKSSLLIALFRISEPRSGTIMIDGLDISKLGLRQLRSKLGIIPQDPVLFTGSLRHNLDPFNNHGDARLWEVLSSVEMDRVVKELPGQLMAEISEGGRNFSVGQRQLLCMARALLLNPKILLLDEATASLDKITDTILQQMIRKNFSDKTVLTIAHRLDTIMDSDMVLVMDNGNIGSFSSPADSLKDKDGLFYGLVYAEGEARGKELEAMIGKLSA